MNHSKQAPVALKIVAAVFILNGIFAVLEVWTAWNQHKLSISFGVLGFLIAPGLMRFRPGWRTAALVFTWIGLIVDPVFILTVLGSGHPVPFTISGLNLGFAPPQVALGAAACHFGFVIWQYKVLTRPDILDLFEA
jgi:hypothetical protein